VQPRFIFTKLGGFGEPPGTTRELDTGLNGIPPIQLVQDQNPPWANDIDPWLNLTSNGPGCTGFHPGVEDPDVNNSCDCQPNGVRDKCDIESGASSDCNSNGIPDECDPDSDGDGIPDGCDNCPDHPNPGQSPECVLTPGEVPQILVAKTGVVPGQMEVTWGASACSAADNNLVYGPLAGVSSHAYSGQVCNVGNTGSHSPFNPGSGSFFFVLVGSDGSVFEGSYGQDSSGTERPASAGCGLSQLLSQRCD
jgi:hypothetical protein